MTEQTCHCGQPLHYNDPAKFRAVQQLVEELGPLVTVTVEDDSYLVPRHFIALHGLQAAEVGALGLEKVS